ncbi:MAG: methylenetetrahydrofolate--tRNA-(uracil(54)-C(5))-methyltransferase (FADH(2)-oxidizing) TrmFO, partial [Chloroflexi bacterium]|nr:methylenetetrahydrofolate--tRNA-(uracil(54)-C(5))-methyltransferase (FADH(2)-oxidizing) TrmFO [Chloroflexota bacterium]
ASGLLKAELRGLGSMVLDCAEKAAVPAGSSLAVDRDLFAACVTERIESHPNIELIREEVTAVPDSPCIIATGPLTSQALTAVISRLTGQNHLYFYDALSPIVNYESIDMNIAFRQSRHDKGEQEEGDYINCPLTQAEYERFYEALITAETISLRQFEREDPRFFEGCMPIEALANRGRKSLAFGPMRPVGLIDPRTGKRPYAIVQLRQDNLAGTLYNIVGFQTNLKWGAQRRVLRLIPGLENAEFMRYGMMHRNTYINSPQMLHPTMQFRRRANLFFAGQIVGVEGYVGNIASGLVAGVNAGRLLNGRHPAIWPPNSMIGALCHYVAHAEAKSFQPMKANFGLLPPPQNKMNKTERYRWYSRRALTVTRRFARAAELRYDQTLAEMGGDSTDDAHRHEQTGSAGVSPTAAFGRAAYGERDVRAPISEGDSTDDVHRHEQTGSAGVSPAAAFGRAAYGERDVRAPISEGDSTDDVHRHEQTGSAGVSPAAAFG